MMKRLISMYVVYVAYFLGVGMVSSGVVLMPFNPIRYSIILAIGLLLFGTGSYINEFIIDKKGLSGWSAVRVVLISLSLAIGIGMISGGISHFKESPVYASYLIPIGVSVSFTSFAVKNGFKFPRPQLKVLAVGILAVALSLHVGLASLASMQGTMGAGGDVFKHGTK